MGRAFEFRKERRFKRWDKMAKQFTRIGREIAIAVKESGPIPENNPRLRSAIQNAKSVNMPKDRVESAIKRASDKNTAAYQEVVYEGKGPGGIGILVETATDNPTRTVANVRMYFSRNGGELGKTGSLSYLFDRKGLFKVAKENFDPEEMELELIDYGLEEIVEKSKSYWIYTGFEDYGNMQKGLEEKGIETISTGLIRIPTSTMDLDDELANQVLELIDKMEEDDDVQHVFHNLEMGEDDDDEEEAA